MRHKCLVILNQEEAKVFHKDSTMSEYQIKYCQGEDVIPIDDGMETFCTWFLDNIIKQSDDSIDLCVLYDEKNNNHDLTSKLSNKKINFDQSSNYWTVQKVERLLSEQLLSKQITLKAETEEVICEFNTKNCDFCEVEKLSYYTQLQVDSEDIRSEKIIKPMNAFQTYYMNEAEVFKENNRMK